MAKFDPAKPYNALPPLPPAQELETPRVLKACIGARTALVELREAGSSLPNPAILVNTIPVLEAQASSEVENIVTTADELFRFAEGDPELAADPATKEALRYSAALRNGRKSLKTRPLSTATAVDVCRTLLKLNLDIRSVPGTTLRNQATGETVYTPPVGEGPLRDLLANWERFLHNEERIDPLVRMAAGHYQFEAIHPFTDGNGRTGRILNLLFLIEQGLLSEPILYASRAILRNRDEYYRLLLGVTTNGNWEEWILFMLGAVEETAKWTVGRIRMIRQLITDTDEYVKETAFGAYSERLIRLIFEQPYRQIRHVVEAGIAERQTAAKYLNALEKAGVLHGRKSGRDKLFVHTRLVKVLTEEAPGSLAFPGRPGRSRSKAHV